MKTAEERAQMFVDMHLLTRGMTKDAKRVMKKAILRLLKDQDKITLHACSEKLKELSLKCDDHAQARIVWIDEAEKEIMNTKTV
jgi:hypothetical protein